MSDDASAFTQPTVTAHMARGYIPYSIEFGMDYPGAASELGRLLEVGYDDLLATKLSQGTGTNEPWGIFVALDANTNAEVVVTTNAAFGDVDIDKFLQSTMGDTNDQMVEQIAKKAKAMAG